MVLHDEASVVFCSVFSGWNWGPVRRCALPDLKLQQHCRGREAVTRVTNSQTTEAFSRHSQRLQFLEADGQLVQTLQDEFNVILSEFER